MTRVACKSASNLLLHRHLRRALPALTQLLTPHFTMCDRIREGGGGGGGGGRRAVEGLDAGIRMWLGCKDVGAEGEEELGEKGKV